MVYSDVLLPVPLQRPLSGKNKPNSRTELASHLPRVLHLNTRPPQSPSIAQSLSASAPRSSAMPVNPALGETAWFAP